jgi:hypothetical protein
LFFLHFGFEVGEERVREDVRERGHQVGVHVAFGEVSFGEVTGQMSGMVRCGLWRRSGAGDFARREDRRISRRGEPADVPAGTGSTGSRGSATSFGLIRGRSIYAGTSMRTRLCGHVYAASVRVRVCARRTSAPLEDGAMRASV